MTDEEATCSGCGEYAGSHISARIEALEAKLAKAVGGLEAVVQHEDSTFFGPDGEKNKRASWRGVMRKARATLAEIKGKTVYSARAGKT